MRYGSVMVVVVVPSELFWWHWEIPFKSAGQLDEEESGSS